MVGRLGQGAITLKPIVNRVICEFLKTRSPFPGVPIIRIIVFWGSVLGSLSLWKLPYYFPAPFLRNALGTSVLPCAAFRVLGLRTGSDEDVKLTIHKSLTQGRPEKGL